MRLLICSWLIIVIGFCLFLFGLLYILDPQTPGAPWIILSGSALLITGALLRLKALALVEEEREASSLGEGAGAPGTSGAPPPRPRLFESFQVDFGIPLVGNSLRRRDGFGFKGEGILFINNQRKEVEISGSRGVHLLANIPLKLLEKIPLLGAGAAAGLRVHLDRRETYTFPKAEIQGLTRRVRLITFEAPMNGRRRKRTAFLTRIPEEARDIERALSEL